MQLSRSARWVAAVVSILSLVACLAGAVAVFLGAIATERFKWIFLIATLIWFFSATAWSLSRPHVK